MAHIKMLFVFVENQILYIQDTQNIVSVFLVNRKPGKQVLAVYINGFRISSVHI